MAKITTFVSYRHCFRRLNTELYIARRLLFDKDKTSSFSRPIVSIAIAGIALGLAVMIIAMAITTGFKKEIQKKVVGFGSHIQILNLDTNSSYETKPIDRDQEFLSSLEEMAGIDHLQVFGIKAGIIKTENDIQGVVLKGIGSDFNWDFFEESLVEGNIFRVTDTARTNEVLISQYISSLLQLEVGDDFAMYFVQDPPRLRRFTISGIYETSLEEFDKIYVLTDIGHIQRLNNWDENQVSGFEITIDRFSDLDLMTYLVRESVGFGFEEDGSMLKVLSIQDKYPQIFDWINLQDLNVIIILVLMFLVAGFNMVSGLLILILERTQMIGILKSLGSANWSIRKIFLIQSGFMISRGLLWGNLVGIALCLIQYYFGVIKLDQSSYYLSTVPINFNILHILFINIGTLLLTVMMLIIPSAIISRIMPVKTIRFD